MYHFFVPNEGRMTNERPMTAAGPLMSLDRPQEHRSTAEFAREIGLDDSSSDLVAIDLIALGRMAALLKDEDPAAFQRATWNDPLYWNNGDTPSDRSQYLTVGCAINFRFWYLDRGNVQPAAGTIDGMPLQGSMYMWRCLKRCVEAETYPILDAEFLARIGASEFDNIFSDDRGRNPLAVAKEERIANLSDLGSNLLENWRGQFSHLIRATEGSLVKFVKWSAQFRAFDDPLYKLTMVNAILHSGSGLIRFNFDPLPGIDYQLLKQLLRHGILQPSEAILRKLKRGELLDSEESYELRRVALVAFVRISEATRLSGELLDNKWWMNRVQCLDEKPVCIDPALARLCPFLDACGRFTEVRRPLELTRYY
jgi:hypothetical protein